jgi:quercetin dioxygenase-like cupin family protein
MSSPKITMGCSSNVFVRVMNFEHSGDVEMGHSHSFDHLTLLSSGSIQVDVNGVSSEFVAPHLVFIKKNTVHKITALTDNTVVSCIHALRVNDAGDILDPDMIPAGVNPMTISKPVAVWEQKYEE